MFNFRRLPMNQIVSSSKFYAYLSRLRWIKRWGLMRNAEPENVMEHSWEVAVIAHALALIRNQYFMGKVDANAIATSALFHDASEVLTGDLPTPIKYFSSSLTSAYRQIEAIACDELISLLPNPLQAAYQALLNDEQQPESHHQIIKAADTLSAYLKCLSELRAGNLEFSITASELEQKLNNSDLPEVAYFMQTFIPACALPLDGILKNRPVDSKSEPKIIEESVSNLRGKCQSEQLLESDSGGVAVSEHDALYDEAEKFVIKSRKASISNIQRQFKIGYNRAATIIEAMEQKGIVSEANANCSGIVFAPPPIIDYSNTELDAMSRITEMVALPDLLESPTFNKAKSLLTLALGNDCAGQPLIVDLAKMPHLLVASTTDSEKSVALNTMLLSLLHKGTPEEVRLIIIDTKNKLYAYEDIRHLLLPIVTDLKEVTDSLSLAISEMENRFKLMSKMGVKNLSSFNKLITEATIKGEPISDPFNKTLKLLHSSDITPTLTQLPNIVIVIEELADVMSAAKNIEELIVRLAQKAKTVGIHLILATQRPSVDVLTGLIKANIPSRISFQVSSSAKSRTILDHRGAEDLLGQGDMLFLLPNKSIPIKARGAFVTDQEIHRMIANLRQKP